MGGIMQKKTIYQLFCWVFPLAVAAYGVAAHADDANELRLVNAGGATEAYIAVDDEMTIYLWSGKPVAYLVKTGATEDYNVYGFNGKHLGWFRQGAIYDHDGTAACATAQVMTAVAQIEPIKSIQQSRPIRAIPQIAPIQPVLAGRFGETPCRFLLGAGAK
jgi:hypothetical protein